ncbi:related to 54S ribosomal protein MRP49, mitochondrial [Zygosaccharomyces bailii]|nr:related to 54S ribosomal protein MRP49, mitochondrial [Zygosaccharomyces bailii]
MPSIPKQINFLNRISFTTPQAQLRLDPAYSSLKLVFQYENHNGQMGARKFCSQYLPTLKFYNPRLQVDVIRIRNPNYRDSSVPCTLEALGVDGKVLHTLEMKNKHSDDIVRELGQLLSCENVPQDQIVQVKRA